MARVKFVDVVMHLKPRWSMALNDAVKQTIPRAFFDSDDLYTLFIESLASQCDTWEEIPDQYVQQP